MEELKLRPTTSLSPSVSVAMTSPTVGYIYALLIGEETLLLRIGRYKQRRPLVDLLPVNEVVHRCYFLGFVSRDIERIASCLFRQDL